MLGKGEGPTRPTNDDRRISRVRPVAAWSCSLHRTTRHAHAREARAGKAQTRRAFGETDTREARGRGDGTEPKQTTTAAHFSSSPPSEELATPAGESSRDRAGATSSSGAPGTAPRIEHQTCTPRLISRTRSPERIRSSGQNCSRRSAPCRLSLPCLLLKITSGSPRLSPEIGERQGEEMCWRVTRVSVRSR